MNIRTLHKVVLACLLSAATALAAEQPLPSRDGRIIYGGNTAVGIAAGDTINLMAGSGAGAPHVGDFESGWNGWTTADVTQPTESHWQVSDYNQAVGGDSAAWCGDLSFARCNGADDLVGGYGDNWHELLVYRTTVADPLLAAEVTVTSALQYDTEPGYDFVRLSVGDGGGGFTDIQAWDGRGSEATANTMTLLPAEFVNGADVVVWFRFQSDGNRSDADCSWPTAGALQIDDITVTTRQTGQTDIVSFTDFQDGGYGDWAVELPGGVGDFAALWGGLEELDPCATDYSQLVAFIDDGQVVPGTGGTMCTNWCYGPGGYVVNTTGGLAGRDAHLHSVIDSPVMTWPDDSYAGIAFSYDVYRHEDLVAEAPGMFCTWSVRSADTDGSASNGVQVIAEQPFRNHNFVSYGGPAYKRSIHNVTGLMNPGRDEVQVRLGVYELGWVWGWNGDDGNPAPYFDNVAVKVFPHLGPAMTAREVDLAQDGFPEVDVIDFADLGSLHVRFDMARNIAPVDDLRNDPGDSLVVEVAIVREGAVLNGAPELHYVIDANPVFDSFRTTATSGSRAGMRAVGATGVPDPTAWAFDLPDTGCLFPGDVLHYYIRAGDDVGGDGRYTTLPADISGFGDFSVPGTYDGGFVVRALPTIAAGGPDGYTVPGALLWIDSGRHADEQVWHTAFAGLSLFPGLDYDLYYTNGPGSGVGNGLGGRTGGPALEHYADLCYTSGDRSVFTLSNGDFSKDAGDDIGALHTWMGGGGKDLFLTGDDLASDLAINAGPAGRTFSEDVMGVDLVIGDIRRLIAGQAAPLVFAVPGNPVFETVGGWTAYGGCMDINTFDAVTPRAGAIRLAEFGDLADTPGAYSFAAATLNVDGMTNRVISLPYAFEYVFDSPGALAKSTLPARAQVLKDVLAHFDVVVDDITEEPEFPGFDLGLGPNPFYPRRHRLRIFVTLKAPGDLAVKIYDLRGQLVLTLLDEAVVANGSVRWDGKDASGVMLASGVYFAEARMGSEVLVRKFTMFH